MVNVFIPETLAEALRIRSVRSGSRALTYGNHEVHSLFQHPPQPTAANPPQKINKE